MHATHVPATKIPPNSHSQMFSKQKSLKQNLLPYALRSRIGFRVYIIE
jgi:hypothetical protein